MVDDYTASRISRLGFLRLQQGLKQHQLGARADVHPSDVSKLESLRVAGYKPMLRRLAAALGVPAGEAHTLQDLVDPDTGVAIYPGSSL